MSDCWLCKCSCDTDKSGQDNLESPPVLTQPRGFNQFNNENVPRLQPVREHVTHSQLPQKKARTYLFIGSKRSGKSTAIKNIFGSPTGTIHQGSEQVETLCYNDTTVVEARGFESYIMEEENKEIIGSIRDYMSNIQRTFTTNYPELIFITAKLNDNRFHGNSSEFRYVLNHVRDLKIVDDQCLNVALLLSHKDKPDVASNVHDRARTFKAEFRDIFSTNPVCMFTGNEPMSMEDIRQQMKPYENNKNCREFLDVLNKIRKL